MIIYIIIITITITVIILPNHMADRAARTLSQTPAYTARPWVREQCIVRCAYLLPRLLLVVIAHTHGGMARLS